MSDDRSAIEARQPLSPHLSIYKPQITSMLSILHRITGVALFLGALLFAWWIAFSVYGCESCFVVIYKSLIGRIFLVGWSFALYYHLYNGIRHLYWDIGKGFELASVTRSGWAVLILSVITTALTWAAALGYVDIGV